MGGSKKKQTTQTYKPAGYVEGAAQQAIGLGRGIANQQYQAYEGPRVAGLSENEQMGMQMARDNVGIASPYYEEAAGLARRGSQQFADADMSQYMNPYIQQALDPAARQIREQGALQLNQIEGRAASMNAFGGSRAALLRSEAEKNTLQGISDLYSQGMAAAYNSAVSIWGDERARDLQSAGRIQDLGTAFQNMSQMDISTLMATGATDRNIQQAMLDFDYQQFIENRDWGFRQLGGLIAALEGTKGSTTTTQSTTSKESGGGLAQALGIAATLIGAFYNPVGTAAGAVTQGASTTP